MTKMEVDYSSTVEEKIPECERLAKENKLNDALEILLSLEKQARTGADTHSLSKILVTIAKLCFEKKDIKLLSENIVLLTKRRGQIKQAITKMIQECCSYVDAITDKQTKLDFIDTLRTVTAGKIYVEVERARLTYKLACLKEADGNVVEAATLLQELQVETFGTMERREKVELLLEQIRLGLAKKDYIRTQIVAKKIQTKFFDDESYQDLKLRYYKLMIELDDVDRNYLNACKHYRAVYNTPSIKEDVAKKQEAMKNIVLYIVLSPFDNEQSDLIHRIAQEKYLEELPYYNNLLKLFNTAELIDWSVLENQYQSILRAGTAECAATQVFDNSSGGNQRWKDLKNRVVEHNIRIMAKYYKRVTLKRMTELLCLSLDETEEVLTNLVINKTIWAKVNRLEGVVNFKMSKPASEVLNDWSHNINTLMNNVCKAGHLINKELMIHQYLHKTSV